MKKKLIKNLLLVLTMVVLCFAVCVMASAETEGYYTYEVVDGNAIITDVDESISGDIVIPDTLGGYPVTEIGDGVAFFNLNITGITIPDSVKRIGNEAFDCCGNLEYINIGDGVTYIGDEAFFCCFHVCDITLGNSVTYIGQDAFTGCIGVTNITVPDSVTEIAFVAFFDLLYLEKITIKSMDANIGEYALCVNDFDISGMSFQEMAELLCIGSFTEDYEAWDRLNELYSEKYIYTGTICCHSGSTAEAYAIDYNLPYELVHFYEGDWTYDYDNLVRYRKCIHCDEMETEVIEPVLPEEPEVPDTPETPEEKPESNSKEKFFIDLFDIIYSFIELLINLFTK